MKRDIAVNSMGLLIKEIQQWLQLLKCVEAMNAVKKQRMCKANTLMLVLSEKRYCCQFNGLSDDQK